MCFNDAIIIKLRQRRPVPAFRPLDTFGINKGRKVPDRRRSRKAFNGVSRASREPFNVPRDFGLSHKRATIARHEALDRNGCDGKSPAADQKAPQKGGRNSRKFIKLLRVDKRLRLGMSFRILIRCKAELFNAPRLCSR
jgi:hypothetical protein